jgi:glutathione synthase/RimK-type ligase-like ATP-grasp enzyme
MSRFRCEPIPAGPEAASLLPSHAMVQAELVSPPSDLRELPLAVQLCARAAERMGAQIEVLDPEYGYLFCVSLGGRSATLLGGRSPLNDAVATRLCEDKYYTGVLLERAGFKVPKAARCVDPDYFQLEHFEGRTGIEAGAALARRNGYPVVVKPNRMSHGRHVELVRDDQELQRQVRKIWQFDYIALVQQVIEGVDLRFDFLDGEYLAGYMRRPLVVRGDGQRSIRELLSELKGAADVSARAVLAAGFDPDTIPRAGEELNLGGQILNLNRCATAELIESLPAEWLAYCRAIGRALNLRHFGVDLRAPGFDCDPRQATVLEVNSSPLLVQLYRLGHAELAVEAQMKVLAAIFES